MEMKRILGATRHLGPPEAWNEDERGPCVHLHIRDEVIDGLPYMMAAFEPTPQEIEWMKEGKPIILGINGVIFNPIFIQVGYDGRGDQNVV